MINNITGNYEYVGVNSYDSPPHINSGLASAGIVRYSPSLQCLEVYDGNTWYKLGSSVNVDLSPNVKDTLQWAKNKMEEERNWRVMADKNPAIRDAYEKFKQAEEQLKIVEALVKEDNVAG